MKEKIIFMCLLLNICQLKLIPSSQDKRFVFQDNFDGNKLNTNLWEKCPEWQRQNGGKWYNKASYLDGKGHLILDILPDPKNPGKILSGAIRTKGKFQRAFGYFEARIKFPILKGTWGAFWLMGDSVGNVDGSGRDGTQIDIIQSIFNQQKKANHALHWDGYQQGHHKTEHKYLTNVNIYDGRFHTFGLSWTKTQYVFYIDGNQTWRTNAGGVCQNPLYIKLTTQGAPWTGPLDSKNLPKKMIVDYVKVRPKK